jgi:glucans biosynthesis protein
MMLAAAAWAAEAPFDFEVLQFRAKMLAEKPYETKPVRVPGWLKKYSYDQLRDIRFDPRQAVWRAENLPFQLQFYHPGGTYVQPVRINTLAGRQATPVEFSTTMFDYGANKPGRVSSELGFAGFRVLCTLNTPDHFDELVSFLGASYFRGLAKDQHYGISARGIAVNPGGPGPEEFPAFEEFWITRPEPDAKSVTVFALLDGPSLTGAYQFVILPGTATVMTVRGAVYCRKNPGVFGIAPLTSMFAHGENTGWARDDFRPEVHDSDGLLLTTGAGEWIWRPLVNPASVQVASFQDQDPRGFGLLQRDRKFEHYDDLEAYYHLRPSVWVEPVGNWGAGAVRLVELPTADEFSDNIVACWVPAHLPPPGTPIEFEYNLHWMTDPEARPPAGYTASTRIAAVAGHPDLRRFVLEFTGPYLSAQPEDPAIEALVTVGAGAQQHGGTVVQKNRFNGAWRVVFEVKPDPGAAAVELRCFLRKGPHVLTETWSYLWNP